MGASKQTPNIKLPQWQASDRIEMADFNNAMSTIDSALTSRPTLIFQAGTTAPEDKRLFWIDTTPVTGGLKAYYNGEWRYVAAAFAPPAQ